MARILSIDDDPDLQDLIEMALTGRGHQIERAFTGEEGLDKAKAFKPELILLDMMLPTLNGLEVLKGLKADAELKDIPVIVVSAFYGEGAFTERSIKALGVRDFLQKPVRLEELAALIQCALGARQAAAPRPTAG